MQAWWDKFVYFKVKRFSIESQAAKAQHQREFYTFKVFNTHTIFFRCRDNIPSVNARCKCSDKA